MGLFKSAAAVASINFKRWLKDARVRFIFLFMGILVCFYLWPYTYYGLASGQKCSVWVLPILFHSGAISVNLPKMLFHLGMLLLLCDAPFMTRITPYMVVRSRRDAWCLGECIYIILAALVYALFLSGLSMLVILPAGTFGNDWGGVLHDLVYGKEGVSGTEIGMAYQFQLNMEADLYQYVYPQGGQLYTFTAMWFSFSFLGLIMYLMSLKSGRLLPGMCVAGVFVFLDPFLVWLVDVTPYKWGEIISPVCWTSVDQMGALAQHRFMTISFALTMYAVWIVVLVFAIWRVSRKAVIECRKLR